MLSGTLVCTSRKPVPVANSAAVQGERATRSGSRSQDASENPSRAKRRRGAEAFPPRGVAKCGRGQPRPQPSRRCPWPARLCPGSVLRNVVVTADPFRVMWLGEKKCEYREKRKYWRKRLFTGDGDGAWKGFKFIHIALGFRKGRPQFLAKCDGVHWEPPQPPLEFSTGYVLPLQYRYGYWVIELGSIVWHSGVARWLRRRGWA